MSRICSSLCAGSLASNTVFGYSVFAALLFTGLHRALALLLATCAGVVFNFFSTGRMVFGNRDLSRLPRFVAAYGIIYLFNLAVMEILVAAGANTYVAGAGSIVLATVAAYALQSRFVFSRTR